MQREPVHIVLRVAIAQVDRPAAAGLFHERQKRRIPDAGDGPIPLPTSLARADSHRVGGNVFESRRWRGPGCP